MATTNNEKIIRDAYQVAEVKNIPGWIACFTEDGTFTDESIGVTYRGEELGWPVENYAKAFPDMHRELYRFFVTGDTVIVELALQGTHKGPLALPFGSIPLRGREWMRPVAMCFAYKTAKSSRSIATRPAQSSWASSAYCKTWRPFLPVSVGVAPAAQSIR
jgi:hypothetical protein